MNIRKANYKDLEEIRLIYQSARKFMSDNGNPNQWGNNNPPLSRTEEDLRENNLYVVEDDKDILAVFFYKYGDDPTYKIIYQGSWLNNSPYGVIHRIAVSDKARGKGIAGICFDFAYSQCKNLKIDTHKDNIPMQRALAKHGFKQCGIIHLVNGDERIAFQKTEDNNE
ncbi:MAG: GNAT family N-acetyltransferase [Clostridia bacterium]|nr:GNAT family N-acetyltransferase [Clostridia bacterium]